MVADGNPTGDVNAVTWKLLAAVCGGMGAAIAWLVSRLNKAEDTVQKLHEQRLSDRDKFEAQLLAWRNSMKDRKGVSP